MGSVMRTYQPNKRAVQTGHGPSPATWTRFANTYMAIIEMTASESASGVGRRAAKAVKWLKRNAWTVLSMLGTPNRNLSIQVGLATSIGSRSVSKKIKFVEHEQLGDESEEGSGGGSGGAHGGVSSEDQGSITFVFAGRELKKVKMGIIASNAGSSSESESEAA